MVATGFDPYLPEQGELGFGSPGVVTLPELKEILATSSDAIRIGGRRVRTLAYVYCVGSRQEAVAEGHPNTYCSRYCCTAAVREERAPLRAGGTRRVRVPPLLRRPVTPETLIDGAKPVAAGRVVQECLEATSTLNH